MEAKPKLVLVTDDFPFGKGEASFILPELPYLQEKFDVTIVSKNSKDEQASRVDPSIKVYRYPGKSVIQKLLYSLRGLFDKDTHEELSKILRLKQEKKASLGASFYVYTEACAFFSWLKQTVLKEIQPDIFYTYWNSYATYALVKNKRRLKGAKIVTRMHRYDVFQEWSPGKRQPYKKQTDRGLDQAFFIGEKVLGYYVEHFASGKQQRKYQVARLGVKRRTPAPWEPSETLRLFSCSFLVPVKRVDLLIQGLSRVEGIRVEWVHAGGGPLQKKLAALAEQLLGQKENINYDIKGHMGNDMIMARFAEEQIDSFISVTESEGIPVSMMEACSFGVPVISTDAGGTGEIVNQELGMLLPVDIAPQEIADALIAFHGKSVEEKRALRQAAFRMWEQNYDADKNYPRFVDSLVSLLER